MPVEEVGRKTKPEMLSRVSGQMSTAEEVQQDSGKRGAIFVEWEVRRTSLGHVRGAETWRRPQRQPHSTPGPGAAHAEALGQDWA